MNQIIISAILLLLLDSVFIYSISTIFKKQIMDVQGSPMKINKMGAILCYLFLIGGLNYFILKPHRPVKDAFILGLVVYGVYETTTYALLKNWRLQTVMIDTLWGGTLFALTTYLTYKLRS
jgi:uncharacterized membrane protein